MWLMQRTLGPPSHKGGHGSQRVGAGFPITCRHPGGDMSSVTPGQWISGELHGSSDDW